MAESTVLDPQVCPSPPPLVQAGFRPRGALGALRGSVRLLALDTAAVAAGWLLVAWLVGGRMQLRPSAYGSPLLLLALLAGVLAGNWARGLYAEAMADRAVELVGCARACFVAVIATQLGGKGLGWEPSAPRLGAAAGVCLVLLMICRSAYRAHLTARRRANELVRPVIVVGTNGEAYDLCRLLDQDCAFGFRPWGVVGDRREYDRYPFEPPWLGETSSVAAVAEQFRIDQVFVAHTALSAGAFSKMSRTLMANGVKVAVGSGLPSVDQRRLKIMPIAETPMYSLDPPGPSRLESFVKRGVDVIVSLVGLVLGAPLMLLTALAILVCDGRPVLFRQRRMGRHGVPFTMYKFRTMVRDADIQIINLLDRNERQGPLFKLSRDPRATRLGRILRETSLDELPQLLNVLQGRMSLVGPRPALVSETERFSTELLARNGARPGITGLWQVEAGDDPSFLLYQHLDLYYVENWSFSLDLSILMATVPTVFWRTFDRLLLRGRRPPANQNRVQEASPAGQAPGEPISPVSSLLDVMTLPFSVPKEVAGIVSMSGRPQAGTFSRDVAVISTKSRASVPLGLAFAKSGLSVVIHESDQAVVDLVNRGRMPVRGSTERKLLRAMVRQGRLRASLDVDAVAGAECLVLVLDTTERALDQVMSCVAQAVESIAGGLRDGQLLILENSLDPGVAQHVEGLIAGLGCQVDVALSRERPSGGSAFRDFESMPQVLSGCTPRAFQRAERLFRSRTGA